VLVVPAISGVSPPSAAAERRIKKTNHDKDTGTRGWWPGGLLAIWSLRVVIGPSIWA
jgi:hypothetical protein